MQLLALAAQQVVKGNSVTVLPVKGNSDLVSRFRDVGVEVDLSIVNRNPIKQYLWLRKFLMKTEFDVLHAHLPRAQVLAVYANRDFRRTVISRHDAMQFISNFPPWLSKLVWKSVRKRSKHTIVISSAIRERMLERGEMRGKRMLTSFTMEFPQRSVLWVQVWNRTGLLQLPQKGVICLCSDQSRD